MYRWILCILCALCCWSVLPAHAAPTVTEMSKLLVCDCPDCGKQTVDQCANGCARGKELAGDLKKHIAAGKGEQQILDAMGKTYGDHILAMPPQSNFWGRMAPIMPFAILLLGLLPITYIMRTRHQKARAIGPKRGPENAPAINDERLNEALRKLDY